MNDRNRPRFSLQPLLDAHEQPFVLIDAGYRIVAANRAYCEHYNVSPDQVTGARCFRVHHNSERPCHQDGEECPLQRVLDSGDRYEVLHVHYHEQHLNQPECVSLKGYPVTDEQGRRYLGELITPAEEAVRAVEADSIEDLEAGHISRLLEQHRGHRRKVADVLKISERTLYRKLVKYGLTGVGRGDEPG